MRRNRLAGILIALSLQALAAGLVMRHVPTESPLGPLARILDSLAPGFLIAALVLAGAVALAGARWTGGVLAAATLAGAGFLWADHARLSLPRAPELAPDLRVLFWNMRQDNRAYADRAATAILEADPDVVVIAEGAAMQPALWRLRDAYDFVSPCPYEACQIVVATKAQPARFWRLSLNAVWPDRYAVVELGLPSGGRVFVAASQLLKPWLSGLSEAELARIKSQYDWLAGPVVAVGDFNAAPWSRPVTELLAHTGFRGLRRPVGTWPARAGAFGVPIDQVFVHGGARVVSAEPFGTALSSNHRGLLVEIALPRPPGGRDGAAQNRKSEISAASRTVLGAPSS